MGCRSAKDKQRREGAVSQRKTHVDDNEVSEEWTHIQSSVRPRAAQVTLSSGLEEGNWRQIIAGALGRPFQKKTTHLSSTELTHSTVSNSWDYDDA